KWHTDGLLCSTLAPMATTEKSDRRSRRDRPDPARPARAPRPAPQPVPRPRRTPGSETMIEFREVCKSYESGDVGLDGASFEIERGEWVFIVGSTGSGKSTIMRLLIKELDATSGAIVVAGRNLADIDRKKVPSYRRNLGVVFQDFKLLPNRTVYDNVAYALQVTGAGRKQIRQTVPDILRL